MRKVFAIASRECLAYFRLPVGWVVVALYLLLSGLVVAFTTLTPGEPATLRPFFSLSSWLLLVVAPAVSMRLYAEEFRSGTIEPLMTAPVSDWAVGVGKYLGANFFLVLMFLPTLAYPFLLERLSTPDWGPFAAGYLGLTLLGGLYTAVGMLASALTSNQTVAFLCALFSLLVALLTPILAPAYAGSPWDTWLYELSVHHRMSDFARGVVDTAHVVFFIALSAWFVALAVAAVESRRWR